VNSLNSVLPALLGEILQNGERREVEIRGATIWAVQASPTYFVFNFHSARRNLQQNF